MHPDRFEDRGWHGYPRCVPIDEAPPLRTQGVLVVLPGDLVKWNIRSGSNPFYYSPKLGARARGLVIETRWCIVDWFNEYDQKDFHYCPEAVVSWSDDTMTNSHHGALKIVSRPKSSSGRPIR